jgi:hypothetical protein
MPEITSSIPTSTSEVSCLYPVLMCCFVILYFLLCVVLCMLSFLVLAFACVILFYHLILSCLLLCCAVFVVVCWCCAVLSRRTLPCSSLARIQVRSRPQASKRTEKSEVHVDGNRVLMWSCRISFLPGLFLCRISLFAMSCYVMSCR